MKRALVIFVVFVLLLTGCAPTVKKEDNGRLKIVTTIFPIYDFVRAVSGDLVDIKLLVDPGTEVHSFDPTPSDVAAIYNADLFFYIGGESDTWVESVLADTSVNKVRLIECVSPLTEDGHEEIDEHIWTSPENAILILEKIKDSIVLADGDNAEIYKNNFISYSQRIKEADNKLRKIVNESSNKFILFADRFPFKYFTDYYGIGYEAAFGGCAISTDISIKTMNRLIKVIEDKNISTVFCVEMSNRNIANALSSEMGVEVVELHSAHNVSKGDFENGITYADIMERNIKSLERGIN